MKAHELIQILSNYPANADINFYNQSNGLVNINHALLNGDKIELSDKSPIEHLNHEREKLYERTKSMMAENIGKTIIVLMALIFGIITTPSAILFNPTMWNILNVVIFALGILAVFAFAESALRYYKLLKRLKNEQ